MWSKGSHSLSTSPSVMRVVRTVTVKTSYGHWGTGLGFRLPWWPRVVAVSYRGNWRCLRGSEVIGRNDSGSHFLLWCRAWWLGKQYFCLFFFLVNLWSWGLFFHTGNSQPIMDVRVGVEGSQRGRKREKKRQERRYILYVFWLRQNSVSQLWIKIHFRYIQTKAQVKDMSQIVWKLWMLLCIFNKLCFCMSCSMWFIYIYTVVCNITF